MKYKLKISKKIMFRFALFITLIGAAILFDIYFEKHPVEFGELKTGSNQAATEYNAINLFTPTNSFTTKISVQKTPSRILFKQSHNKLLQKYHRQHNFEMVKKTDSKTPNNPIISSLRHLIAGHYYLFPEEDPPEA